MTIDDTVPAATTVLGATSSKGPVPAVSGQQVSWTGAVDAQQAVTVTISVQGTSAGAVTNTATFSGTAVLEASAQVFVSQAQVYLPIVLKALVN